MRRRGSCLFILSNIALIGLTPPTLAATPTPVTVDAFTACISKQDFTTFGTAQTLKDEISLRRNLLNKVIGCASSDAETLQKTLKNIKAQDAVSSAIQNQLDSKLSDAINFYNAESAKVGTAGISGTQNIAKEMLTWRAANYIPAENTVGNFALWSSNQALFTTAGNRLNQTQRIVSFIENVAPNPDLQNAMSAARESTESALAQNKIVGQLLINLQPPEESAAAIQQSLQSLADAYQKFSDLTNLIQKLLPTTTN